jgi:hypothetical protein
MSNDWQVLRACPQAPAPRFPSAAKSSDRSMNRAFDTANSFTQAYASHYTDVLDFNPHGRISETTKANIHQMPSILESRVGVLELNTTDWFRKLTILQEEMKRERSNMCNR